MSRYSALESRVAPSHASAIRQSHILVVGAGGIGCEVLKNLVMVGFTKIDTIDLDVIDPSNLNRQFLFRPEHVNHPKATVAAQSAMAFNPDAHITAYHKNVKEPEFNVAFFEKYDLVLNALDNVEARRHVNRLCLASSTPLIESGTMGYVGQIMPIVKGEVECYECRPKSTAKVYPICTIRSTPDKPVHCIVWAKELFKLILGPTAESMLFEAALSEGEEVGGEKVAKGIAKSISGIQESSTTTTTTTSTTTSGTSTMTEYSETSEYMKYVAFPAAQTAATLKSYVQYLFVALFHTEVAKQVEAGVYKTSKKTPRPLSVEIIERVCEKNAPLLDSMLAGKPTPSRPSAHKGWERRVWSVEENLAELLACVAEVWTATATAGDGVADLVGSYVFDKDFKLAMCFVAAASNLRSIIFDIPTMSFHDAKGVAGNIIPAIASTNAIIAGLQVAQAVQLLGMKSRGEGLTKERCKAVFCQRYPTRRGYYLQPLESAPPSQSCYVCNSNQQTLEIDTSACTLGDFVTKVVKGKLGLVEPSIMIGASVIYEEGEDMDDSLLQHLSTPLEGCPAGGIRDSTLVTLEDFVQDLKITVLVRHVASKDFDPEKCPEGFRLAGSSTLGGSSDSSRDSVGQDEEQEKGEEDDNDCCMILNEDHSEPVADPSTSQSSSGATSVGHKRGRPASDKDEVLEVGEVKRPAL